MSRHLEFTIDDFRSHPSAYLKLLHESGDAVCLQSEEGEVVLQDARAYAEEFPLDPELVAELERRLEEMRKHPDRGRPYEEFLAELESRIADRDAAMNRP